MAGNRKVVSFFLASPGDLIPERKIAKQVADELNSMLSIKFNIHIELVGWEDTVSSAGRPQEIINRDLDRCDVFIGLVWKRWGSAPDNESKYQSGFEEEFTIATTGNKQKRKPLISLFFKKVDAPAMSDPGEQLQRVMKFRKSIIENKSLLFQDFENLDEFEGIIRKCISNYVFDHIDLNDNHPQATHTPEAEIEKSSSEKINENFDQAPIRGQSANFIQSILRRNGDASSNAKLEPFEVARLRLISNGLGDSLNDVIYLGPHDCNLIYKNKDGCVFDKHEVLGLLQSGAKNLQYQNIPLWFWLKHPKNELYHLAFLTLTIPDDGHAIVNSILDVMALTETEIKEDDFLKRENYLNLWFSEKKNPSVKNAALRYLCVMGVVEDLDTIHKEIIKNDSQTITLANEAYITIKLRIGVGSALKAIAELQPATLSAELVGRIFFNHSHISSDELDAAMTNRNKLVRERSIELLILRGLLANNLVEAVQQDPEPSVRGLAIKSLLNQGASLSEDEAKAIIMKDRSKPTTEEDAVWVKYQPLVLSAMDSDELERRTLKNLPLIPDTYIELCRRNIETSRHDLTRNLLDRFEAFYSERIVVWAESAGGASVDIIKQFDSIKNHIIGKFVRKSLTVLIETKSKKDVAVVRASLSDPTVVPIVADLEYLYQFGEWQDIPLVMSLVDRFKLDDSGSLLSGFGIPRNAQALAVKILLKLGKNRLADILKLECSLRVKRHLICSINDKEFVSIDDDVILSVLQDSDDEVRKNCALKCAKTYSKNRLSSLLDRYNEEEQSFYNVIYWLDFGLYGSRGQVRNVCRKTFIL
ncbi:DUF4062 domain-containing protein [Pseudomonas yamanorum]|uniref:DUF4062 domain-containing protein n=1 Tax=Pseudomonas yamanorum TaxID=515393 RepID=UPI0015A09E59|nr:DUF4062 domain-containing protein [Pseudomonas yamanorum]